MPNTQITTETLPNGLIAATDLTAFAGLVKGTVTSAILDADGWDVSYRSLKGRNLRKRVALDMPAARPVTNAQNINTDPMYDRDAKGPKWGMAIEQITSKDLSKTGVFALYDRYVAADKVERAEIRRQVEGLRVARRTGHGGYAMQEGRKRACLDNFDHADRMEG